MEKTDYKIIPLIKRMLAVAAKEDKKQFFRVACLTIIAGVYPFMSVVLPKLAIGTLEQFGKDAVKPLVIVLLVYLAIAGLCGFMNNYLTQVISAENMRIRLRYIIRCIEKIQNMDYKNVEDSTFWEKYDKAMNAGNNNTEGIEGLYNHLAKLPAMTITLIGMCVIGMTLSPFVVLALVLHVIVIMWVSAKVHDLEYSKKQEIAKASRRMRYFRNTTQDFTFGKDIRIFDLRQRILDNYKSEINAYVAVKRMLANNKFLLGGASLLTLLLTNVVMYGILIEKTYNGMPISSFTMYVALITSLMALMIEYGEYMTFIRNEGEYVYDYFRLIDAPLITEGEQSPEIDGQVEIVFDHVTFRYPNTDVDIYKDFSFTIHKGERLAIVGINGAGKSTLVKLICGLYEPNEGHIYINGIDIREWNKQALYNLYSTVFQDFNILAFTLRENVTCKKENSDDDKVREVLERVGLGKKLSSLDKGLDQMMLKVIDEQGTDFSGGERQKLAIARALYKDAPMIIMDEPTAALDALAEAEIYESFSSLVEGKTAIYISHRLASTKFCDKIALFDKDGVKEYGTHEELMEKQGLYYAMFVVQGKYYQEEAAV